VGILPLALLVSVTVASPLAVDGEREHEHHDAQRGYAPARLVHVSRNATRQFLDVSAATAADHGPHSVLWDMRVHPTGFEAIAKQVVAEKQVLLAAGWVEEATTGFHWRIRAHDSRSGRLLWEDGPDLPGFASGIAVSSARAYAAGFVQTGKNLDWVVRATTHGREPSGGRTRSTTGVYGTPQMR
jgi:hypothetical protein